MIQVIGRVGKGKLYETIEQMLGAADLQHEQDQTMIGQLKSAVETLTKRAEAAEGRSAGLARDLENAEKEIAALNEDLGRTIASATA